MIIEGSWLWLISGLVLWIIEIFTSGFVMGLFGTACFIVAPFVGAGVSFTRQLILFGVSTAVLLVGIRPMVVKHLYKHGASQCTNVDALIGKTGVVIEEIDPADAKGRVRIGGEDWRAVTPDESRIEVSARVIVRRIDGCKVIVEAVEEA